MTAKLQDSSKPWVDPEDAPELCDDFFEKGVWKVGEKTVSRQAARVEAEKVGAASPARGGTVSTTIQVDAEILAAFEATGDGWEARMNDALRDWLKSH